MSKKIGFRSRFLMGAIVVLLGAAAAQPCCAMLGYGGVEGFPFPFCSNDDGLRPCTRGHYGASQKHCSRCVDDDRVEKAKLQKEIEQRKKTQQTKKESEKSSS